VAVLAQAPDNFFGMKAHTLTGPRPRRSRKSFVTMSKSARE
jgi:hypothetical protein